MPVFVGNDIIQHDHAVKEGDGTLNAKLLTAFDKMLIHRDAVAFFLRLENAPCGNQIHILINKILAHAVRRTFIPGDLIRHMGDAKTFHDSGSNDLIKRLLAERIAAAFYQTPFPANELPTLFKITVRSIIRGREI